LPRLSTSTSAYCQARAWLPLPMIRTLTRQTGGLVTDGAPNWWHWQQRRVRFADGATMTLADTEENQAKYPQPKSQKDGLGFPICRMVVLLWCAAALTGYSSSTAHASAAPTFAWASGSGTRPPHRLAEAQETGLDESGGLRSDPGHPGGARFQAGRKIMVTTFLCPKDAPKSILKVLYRSRWNVELDLRNIKTTLGMEHLRCKTPDMAIKELWVYLMAYNLIRLPMAQAALLADQIPRQLSFKHTVQVWISWQQRGGATHDAVVIRTLLVLIAEPRVGLRRDASSRVH
jgi:hypothetical protein